MTRIKPADIEKFIETKVQTVEFVLPEIMHDEIILDEKNSSDLIDKEDPADYETHQRRIREMERPNCGICLTEFEPGDQLKVLSCSAVHPADA